MGMRYRRPNHRKHGAPYPPRVQITALLLGPWTWFLVLVAASSTGLSGAFLLWALAIVAVWLPWEQWSEAASTLPRPTSPGETLAARQEEVAALNAAAWNAPIEEKDLRAVLDEAAAEVPTPVKTIWYSAEPTYGRAGADVTGHWRRTKSGRKVWVRRHYRRG